MPVTTAADELLADLPALHHWGGRPQTGGLDRRIGRRIIAEVGNIDRPAVIETGAGASTLLFLCLEPRSVISVAPDDELRQRLLAEAETRSIPTDALQYLVERSEIALPELARAGTSVDVALIDGGHGWPTVFVDFCYLNLMLRAGGLLFLDDVQLHSVAQLFLLLRQQAQFDFVSLDGKFATFRKTSADGFLPDWSGQPFIVANSVGRK